MIRHESVATAAFERESYGKRSEEIFEGEAGGPDKREGRGHLLHTFADCEVRHEAQK